ITGGWGFTAKHTTGCSSTGTGTGPNTANCMDTGEFLEIGFDLTAAFPGRSLPCISRFFAESRASGTGLSSSLSDFVKPVNFKLCSISADKVCDASNTRIVNNGTAVHWAFTGHITASGGTLSRPTSPDNWIEDNPDACGFSFVNENGDFCTPTAGQLVSNL